MGQGRSEWPADVAAGMMQHTSGLIVPERLAFTESQGTTYDPDGRRRVVLPDEFRRKLNRVLVELNRHGFGVIVGCSEIFPRKDGKKACGEVMLPVGKDTPDPGFACSCTRIHWGPA